jgi:hypothetical protein
MHSAPRERNFCIKVCRTKICEKRSSNERIEYKKHYSHYQKKSLVDELQEKYLLSPPFSDVGKHE